MNWDQAIAKMQLKLTNKATKTQKNYTFYVNEFKEWSKTPLNKITSQQCQNYCDEAVAVASQNMRVSSLNFFFKETLGMSILLKSHSRGAHAVVQALTNHEMQSIIKKTAHPYKAAVYLMYGCGLKASEVQQLKKTDLNEDFVKTNGRKVAMTKRHWPYIKWAMDKSNGPWLFCSAVHDKDRVAHLTTLQRQIPVSCSRLRDYFALAHVKKGTKINELADILGLSSISSALRYYEHIKRKRNQSLIPSPID